MRYHGYAGDRRSAARISRATDEAINPAAPVTETELPSPSLQLFREPVTHPVRGVLRCFGA